MTFRLRVTAPVRITSGVGLGKFLSGPQVIRMSTPAPTKGNDLAGMGEIPELLAAPTIAPMTAMSFLDRPVPTTASEFLTTSPGFSATSPASAAPTAAPWDWSAIGNAFSKSLNAITPLASTGASLYLQNQQNKLVSSTNNAAQTIAGKNLTAAQLQAQIEAAKIAAGKKKTWVLAGAIGGGIIAIGIIAYFLLRKKTG